LTGASHWLELSLDTICGGILVSEQENFAKADNRVFYIMLVAIALSVVAVTYLIVASVPECRASESTYCGGVYFDPGHH